ncbi:hypothetical protein J437_LFUL012243 [Ladona fulva]|uniref:DUF4774 domain-containing protein n=1 Tax=Ladona fulva TaxID=123851 RepID=A0A8K0KBT3_LADFU|nr:hypothetical protein J437_LFUL012243 [Ladona fulva]
MEKKLYTDAAFDYLGRSVGFKENITLGSNPNGTVLVLAPKAHAEAGAGGTAIAKPLSIAILNSKEDRVIFRPMVSAVAGPGGMAIAEPELIIRKRWEEEASESPETEGTKQKARIQ